MRQLLVEACMIGSFKRNQMEWAIWHVIDRGRMTLSDPPKEVLHLIKRLIDLDRQMGADVKAHDLWRQHYAFIEGRTAGPGGENAYGLLDVACVWLGVELLEAGLPQKEIVEFIRQMRGQLRKALLKLVGSYADEVETMARSRRGSAAEKLRKGAFLPPASRVYVITESVTPDGVAAAERKFGANSNIRWGREQVLAFIEAVGTQRRFMVVEIANASLSLAYLLLISEPAKRGRTASRRGA